MASSLFPSQPQGSIVSQIMQAGGPKAAVQALVGNSMLNLPNGQQVSVQQLADMTQGKTPEQACRELGADYSQFQQLQGLFNR